MKLHATITNSHGKTASKGDNSYMEIAIKRGNRLVARLDIGLIGVEKKYLAVDWLDTSHGEKTRLIEWEDNDALPEHQTGNKQKGEWCYVEHKTGQYGGCSVPHWHE